MDYKENIRQKAEELAKTRLKNTWSMLPDTVKQLEIEWATPEAEKAMEWAAEIARHVYGKHLSQTLLNAVLIELGVIPDITKTDPATATGES